VVGGIDLCVNDGFATVERFDHVTGVWSDITPASPTTPVLRNGCTATLIPAALHPVGTDEVVIEGSFKPGVGYTTHRYFPSTGAWMSTTPNLPPIHSQSAELLMNGTVLLSGGWDSNGGPRANSYVYAPGVTTPWTAGPGLGLARGGHRSVRLPGATDRIVVVGGSLGAAGYTRTCELYQ
jgi:hypothetical protein